MSNDSNKRFGDIAAEMDRPAVNPEVFGKVSGLSTGGRTATQDQNGNWRNSIGLESTEEMRHVSKIWQDKCIPMPVIADQVAKAATEKYDIQVPISDLRVKVEGSSLGLDWGEGFHPMTESGVQKLRILANDARDTTSLPTGIVPYFMNPERVDILPMFAEILQRELGARTGRAAARAEGRGRKSAKSALLRLRPDHETGGNIIRAVLTDQYTGSLDNAFVLKVVQEVMGDEGFGKSLWSHANDDGDRLRGNLLLPDSMKSQPDSDYGVGVSLRNSEIGDGSFSLYAFLFRAICLNGCIWDKQNSSIRVKQTHNSTGLNLDDLRNQVREAIAAGTSHGWNLLSLMNQTQDIRVKDVNRMIASLARDNGLDKPQAQAWANGYALTLQERMSQDMSGTAWAIVNGLTLAAQEFDTDERLSMESAAGKILAPKSLTENLALAGLWESYQDRADLLEERTVELYTVAR